MELHVVRSFGQLLRQLIRYRVEPSGTEEFYGATGILEFQPGEREVMVALVAKEDGVPEVCSYNTSEEKLTISVCSWLGLRLYVLYLRMYTVINITLWLITTSSNFKKVVVVYIRNYSKRCFL